MKELKIPRNKLKDFHYILNGRTPIDHRKTLKENGVSGMASITVNPKLTGGKKPRRTRKKNKHQKQVQQSRNILKLFSRVNARPT